MKRKFTLLLTALALMAFINVDAQISVTTAGSPVTINFTGFTGAGFDNPAGAGQLSSLNWNFTGFSDIYTYGGSNITGDYARGVRAIPGTSVFSGGIYGLNDTITGNNALWIQPTGGDFTPGTATLYLTNNTGSTITSLTVAYDILVLNDNARSNSFNFSYSTDDVTYTAVPSFDFASPGTADGTLSSTPRAGVIGPLNIPNGSNFYLRWEGDDVSGSGSRDEFGLDNVSVTASTGMPDQMLSFVTTSSTINEDTGSFMIEVSVDIMSPNATTVDVVVDTAGTATDPGDFSISPSTLTFPANSTASQFVTVTVVNDLVAEPIENGILKLQNPTNNANIVFGTHTMTIFDNDNIFLSFPADSSGDEATAGTVTITVTMDNPNALAGTMVDVVLDTNSTATDGVDFAFTPATLSFGTGTMETATFSFTVNDDADFEANESIIFALANQTNGAIIAGGTFTYTITNDDAGPSGPCSDLFFSEYIEGSSNNKAIELYNPTDAAIDMSEYSIVRYNNGFLNGSTSTFTGTVAPGDVFSIVNSSADSVLLAQADVTTGTATFYNGNDALELYHFDQLIDVIGNVGQDSVWVVDTGTTGEHTIVRRPEVQEGNTNWTASAAGEWIAYDQNTFSFFGSHTADPCAPSCASPTGILSTVTGPTSVTLSWDVVPGALAYEVSGGVAGSNPSSYITLFRVGQNNTTFPVINLCTNFSYDWRIRTICSIDGTDTLFSDYSATQTFTTDVCAAPASANTINVTNSSATLTWSAVPGAIGYLITGQAQGGSPVTLVVFGGGVTSFQVNNLPSGVSFVWQVRAGCALSTPCSTSPVLSPAVASSFTTLGTSDKAPQVANMFAGNNVVVYPNPFTSSTRIEFSNPENNPYTFVMTDLSGRVVKVVENITADYLIVDREALNSGVYFFELQGIEKYTGKVVLK